MPDDSSLEIVVYGADEPGGINERKGYTIGATYYPDGTQTDKSLPILLQVCLQYNQTTGSWPANGKITLNFATGSIDVYLPAISLDSGLGKSEIKFWIAEDGSVYYARADHGFGSEVTQSALYAMQYDDAGLAKSAFDARKAWAEAAKQANQLQDQNGDGVVNDRDVQKAAQSPAVDAGTDDAWEYDSTSTKSTVIDMSQPDIGYHYYRRIADDDPFD